MPKPNSTEKPAKDFDAVAWVRARRDELSRNYEGVPTKEFVQRISEDGKTTTLWKRLSERHSRTAATP